MPKRLFTDQQEKNICDQYEIEGKTAESLAIEYGCTSPTIANILKRNNINIRGTKGNKGKIKASEEQQKEIARKYLTYKNVDSLLKEYDIAYGTLLRYLKNQGIKPDHRRVVIPSEILDNALNRFASGEHIKDIAKEIGVAAGTLRIHINSYEEKRRLCRWELRRKYQEESYRRERKNARNARKLFPLKTFTKLSRKE